MAIETMNLINVIGLYDDFDRVVAKYILSNDVHLENAFDIFHNMHGLYPYTDDNPHSETLANMREIAKQAGVAENDDCCVVCDNVDITKIERYSNALTQTLNNIKEKRQSLESEYQENLQILQQLEPIQHISVELDSLFHFKYTKVRFGQMPKYSFVKLYSYLGDYNAFFFKLDENKDTVFGVYFSPASIYEKVDSIFASLYFERVRISDKAKGIPAQEIERIQAENERINKFLQELDLQKNQILAKERDDIASAYNEIKYAHEVYDARRYAAHTDKSFYIVGWVPSSVIPELAEQFDKEKSVTFLVEDAEMVHGLYPPTKLRNNSLLKSFEGFVKMYGMPNYYEIDPTFIFAITYTFMFGMMYGDIGHGVVLTLFGLYMDRVRKVFIGGVLFLAGISATIFGVLYGSIFGFEHIYEGLWYKPMHDNTSITNTLLYAVALGAIFVSISMILHMINEIKRRNYCELVFSPNGVIGFIFFWDLIIMVVSIVMGYDIVTAIFVDIFILLPLLILFFREPLIKLCKKEKDWFPKKFGMYFLETFFEMFEILLSYTTNLISFVRVGAYALIHAGMLTVVMTFFETSLGVTSVLILVFGNILVIVLEGLLVAIQVLRLEYYEMFSRFYTGNGKAFALGKHVINPNKQRT